MDRPGSPRRRRARTCQGLDGTPAARSRIRIHYSRRPLAGRRRHNLVLVHTPVHASWLNQVEVYYSILQRKVLTPNDFSSTESLEDRILRFQPTTNASLGPSNGSSRVATCVSSWTASSAMNHPSASHEPKKYIFELSGRRT
jgi:hypothetical protein